MSTPVCIANAVADALGLADVTLPLLPARLAEHLHGPEQARLDRRVTRPAGTEWRTQPVAAQAASKSRRRRRRCGRCCWIPTRWRR